jgi:hypothetical protein
VPVYRLDDDIWLPRPDLADDETGVVAVGGDLRPERLLLAYGHGIFPWPHEGLPLLWFSPDPREILELSRLHVPRSVRKVMRREVFQVTFDTAFGDVILACSTAPRPGGDGIWITAEIQTAYAELHRQGFAHSIEAWREAASSAASTASRSAAPSWASRCLRSRPMPRRWPSSRCASSSATGASTSSTVRCGPSTWPVSARRAGRATGSSPPSPRP